MKNVTNPSSNGAYLEVGDSFKLHFPNQHHTNAMSPQIGEIILLFQKIDNDIKFTHLVSPINDSCGKGPENSTHRYTREVRVLAKSVKEPYISRKNTLFRDVGFSGISQGNAVKISNIKQVTEDGNIESILLEIYSIFLDFGVSEFLDYPFSQNDGIQDFDMEGRKILISHFAYERSNKLSKQKKETAKANDKLYCEICGFDFSIKYGEEYLECHHNFPLNMNIVRKTTPNDLSLVCSNCHRMLHRRIGDNFLDVNELRELVIRYKTSRST
jgi:hypothetical protein